MKTHISFVFVWCFFKKKIKIHSDSFDSTLGRMWPLSLALYYNLDTQHTCITRVISVFFHVQLAFYGKPAMLRKQLLFPSCLPLPSLGISMKRNERHWHPDHWQIHVKWTHFDHSIVYRLIKVICSSVQIFNKIFEN